MVPSLSLSQVIIDVELLGFVYHWGLDVNSLTVIGKRREEGGGKMCSVSLVHE